MLLADPRQFAAALVEAVKEADDHGRDPVDAVLAELAEWWYGASLACQAAVRSPTPNE